MWAPLCVVAWSKVALIRSIRFCLVCTSPRHIKRGCVPWILLINVKSDAIHVHPLVILQDKQKVVTGPAGLSSFGIELRLQHFLDHIKENEYVCYVAIKVESRLLPHCQASRSLGRSVVYWTDHPQGRKAHQLSMQPFTCMTSGCHKCRRSKNAARSK